MSRIAVLPDLLINKIAAGEVIERPASIVRELLDNSIDAGATKIDIDVLHGGRKLIKVSDNGSGMDRDDALLCFERHATSKISAEEDLFNIHTLGFRGEAIPAIASVSKVLLVTSPVKADKGIKIEIGPGNRREVTDAPPVLGTIVEVRDIFYNTPARRKFLKSITTEFSHVIETVTQKAFAYPGISFSLRHNNRDVMAVSSAADPRARFVQLYGEDMASRFHEIYKKADGIDLHGFISDIDYPRSTRSHQLIFVNRRPVKNSTVNHAVYNAYKDVMPREKHPAYFLFLNIDPEKVDVNVHPAKREVRFERPDEIHRLVHSAVSSELNPSLKNKDYSVPKSSDSLTYISDKPLSYSPQGSASEIRKEAVYENHQTDFFSTGMARDLRPFFYIGESFIATVNSNGLLIIDQHAAHERVLYEKFLKKTTVEAEPLFLPLKIELPVKEYNLILKHKDIINSLGLDMDDFGGNCVIVRALPGELKKAEAKELLMDLAAGLLEEETTGIKDTISEESLVRNIAARLACHKSVRGRTHINSEELAEMLAALEKTDEPDKCPHGRPTRIQFSMNDLQKMFKRKL